MYRQIQITNPHKCTHTQTNLDGGVATGVEHFSRDHRLDATSTTTQTKRLFAEESWGGECSGALGGEHGACRLNASRLVYILSALG